MCPPGFEHRHLRSIQNTHAGQTEQGPCCVASVWPLSGLCAHQCSQHCACGWRLGRRRTPWRGEDAAARRGGCKPHLLQEGVSPVYACRGEHEEDTQPYQRVLALLGPLPTSDEVKEQVPRHIQGNTSHARGVHTVVNIETPGAYFLGRKILQGKPSVVTRKRLSIMFAEHHVQA